jgi:hypothetical protein
MNSSLFLIVTQFLVHLKVHHVSVWSDSSQVFMFHANNTVSKQKIGTFTAQIDVLKNGLKKELSHLNWDVWSPYTRKT